MDTPTRILKYRVFPMPAGELPGHVIAVGWQHGEVTVWCEVGDPVRVAVVVVATGGTPPEGWQHVGSAISDELVFHVYEQAKP